MRPDSGNRPTPEELLSPRVLDMLFDSIEDGVVWLDGTGRIRGISRSLAGRLGIPPEAAVGKECRELLACRDPRGSVLCDGPFGCGRVLRGERMGVMSSVARSLPDGESISLESIEHPILDDTGQVAGVIRFFRETPEGGDSPGKDSLIIRLSHELRTPLTSARGYLDLLLSGDVEAGSSLEREFLLAASRSLQQLNDIVGDILNRGIEEWWKGTETRSQE